MKRTLSLILILGLLAVSCKQKLGPKKIEPSFKVLAAIDTTNFERLDVKIGDLDQDTIPEKVMVFDTGEKGEFGSKRILLIYKKYKGEWVLWQQSGSVILDSEQGGIWGDPFEDISIEEQSIVINHFGGSKPKWRYKHRFRLLQNDFHLVHAKVFFASPCDYFEDFNYDLTTGKITFDKEIDNCESETNTREKREHTMKLDSLPRMNNFQIGENKFTFPNSDITVYY